MLVVHTLLNGNAAVTYLFARYSPQEAFRRLRLYSGLRMQLPMDVGGVGRPESQANGDPIPGNNGVSAGTSRWLRFPPFREVLGVLEDARCYLLCWAFGTREAADALGWSPLRTQKTYQRLRKRLQSLEAVLSCS